MVFFLEVSSENHPRIVLAVSRAIRKNILHVLKGQLEDMERTARINNDAFDELTEAESLLDLVFLATDSKDAGDDLEPIRIGLLAAKAKVHKARRLLDTAPAVMDGQTL